MYKVIIDILDYIFSHFAIIISIISLIISIVSLVLSISNFLRKMAHLKFTIENYSIFKTNYNKCLLVNLFIDNRSKNNITINYVDILLDKQQYRNVLNKIFLGETGVDIDGQQAKWINETITMPVKLEPYDSVNGAILIPLSNETNIPNSIKLNFYTSRGKKTKKINCKKYNNI